MSAQSILDQIAAADDIEQVEIEIPEWSLELLLKSPSMAKRSELMEQQLRNRDALGDDGGTDIGGVRVDMNAMQFAVIQACCFDLESDEALFVPENTERDMAMLGAKNGRVVWELFEACQRIAGLAGDIGDDEGPVEAGKEGS